MQIDHGFDAQRCEPLHSRFGRLGAAIKAVAQLVQVGHPLGLARPRWPAATGGSAMTYGVMASESRTGNRWLMGERGVRS